MTDFAQLRKTMVDCQVRPADVTDYAIIGAMLEVPREKFLPPEQRAMAYAEEDLQLAPNSVVLAPRTFAKMLEVADVSRTDTVLDIGCASGYSVAVLSRLAETVIGLEADATLAAAAGVNLQEQEMINGIVFHHPLAHGDAEHGPYDKIFIHGKVEQIPDELLQQLQPHGGRLVAVVGVEHRGECQMITRAEKHFAWQPMFDVAAAPLPEFARVPEFTL